MTHDTQLHDQMKEVADRTRRIETRLTRYLEKQGFDTQTQRPVWRNGQIDIPTMACSVHDVMAIVPSAWPADEVIDVYHQGEFVMSFYNTLA